jgi:DNA-binding NarL/FixJ family response regulator
MATRKNKSMAQCLDNLPKNSATATAVPAVAGRLTSVGIVEDSAGLRRSLVRLISHTPGLCCIGSWSEGKSALAQLPALKPDVVLMDINIPGMDGIECTAQLKALCPVTQVIIVTVYEDNENIFRALQAGACGYMLKRAFSEKILEAITEVCSGGVPMSSDIARKVIHAFQKPSPPTGKDVELTRRETEILELVAQGLVNKEIGDRLDISYWTVKAHVRHIYEKLHVRTRSEAVVKFMSENSLAAAPHAG